MKLHSIVVTMLLMICCTSPRADDTKMITKADVFNFIDSLLNIQKISPKTVTSALKVPIQFAKKDISNDVKVSVAEMPRGSWATKIELRKVPNRPNGGLILIDISPEIGITTADVIKRFGEETRIAFASAHAKVKLPDYYIYKVQGAELRMGILGEGKDLLVSVVIDRP